MEWYEVVVSILSGLVATIPLVVQLVKYVKATIQEKNWGNLVSLVVKLIQDAEEQFENGADKKAWVLSMVASSAGAINYEVDLERVSELIDSLCEMSNMVNVKSNKEVSE